MKSDAPAASSRLTILMLHCFPKYASFPFNLVGSEALRCLQIPHRSHIHPPFYVFACQGFSIIGSVVIFQQLPVTHLPLRTFSNLCCLI